VQVVAPTGSCLFLDGVSDPGNLGTIIRTMACAGIKDLYLLDQGADAFSPKAVRSSMSGIYNVNIRVGTREEILNAINLPIIVADMGGENLFSTKIEGDFCLVIGNEAHGVSEMVRQKADKVVSIPMQKGMESLNAGVSAGILIYVIKNLP
jgi:TrmH family RNA methyltransferase